MKKNLRISGIICVILLASMLLSLIPMSNMETAKATTPIASDLLQYEWDQGGGNAARTRFSAGPAPDYPNYEVSTDSVPSNPSGSSSSRPVAMNGMIILGNNTNLMAYDAATLTKVWDYHPLPPTFMAYAALEISKIAPNYLVVDRRYEISCHEISTGNMMWKLTDLVKLYEATGSGSNMYWHLLADPQLKMVYRVTPDPANNGRVHLYGFDVSDPTKLPTIKWDKISDEPLEIMCAGGGNVYCGSNSWSMFAFDGLTGNLKWRTQITQNSWFCGAYDNGKLLVAPGNKVMCFDTSNGAVLWSYNLGSIGAVAQGGAIAYGKFYAQYVNYDGVGVAAWDIATGKKIWDINPGIYKSARIGYFAPRVADGKVFVDDANTNTFKCLDAYNGTCYWSLPNTTTDNLVIAYGNLYIVWGGHITKITSATTNWSMFRGNNDTPGVYESYAPTDLSVAWQFKTNGPITASPAIVDGKAYIGSHDKNIYCINAYTGAKIWSFTTGYRVIASPAVVGGRVFTGADDGSIYCLDANTGTQIWKTSAGGWQPVIFASDFQPHSSPIVVGNRLYVGALDGKVYCLDTANGNIQWSYQTGNPIGSTPEVYQGSVFIASTDGYTYSLKASDGSVAWKTAIAPWSLLPNASGNQVRWAPVRNTGNPIVGGGVLFIGNSIDFAPTGLPKFYALDVDTGAIIWNITYADTTFPVPTPTYRAGVIYWPVGSTMAAYNATNGKTIWTSYMPHVAYSSPLYADGKIYVGNQIYSLYVFNATDGKKLGWFDTDSQVESSPSAYDGRIYVGSSDWNLYCLQQKTLPAPYLASAISEEQSETPNTEPTPSPALTTMPTTTASSSAAPTAPASPATTGSEQNTGIGTEIYVGIAIAVVAIIAIAAVVLLKRRK
jgi:outer membrane protein assembly factor BamB